ncbi:hypothetical protein AAC387_Pa03g1286 [Persea americana]
MCRTWIKQYSSKLITNGKSTFDHVPCGFGVLIGECEDLCGLYYWRCCPWGSNDAHADNAVLRAVAAERVPAAGTVLLLRWLRCRSNLTYWKSSNWSSRRCGRLKHLGQLSAEWVVPGQMSWIATIITWAVRVILLLVLPLYHLSRLSLSPKLLLLHYMLLSNQSGPNPLLLMHGLYSLKSFLCPVSSPHGILIGGMVHTSHMQLNAIPQSVDEPSNPLRLRCDQSLREAGKLGEAELILINSISP